MSRLADALAALRDAAEAIAPAAVEERREHVAEVLRLIFSDLLHDAPATVQDACRVFRAMQASRARLQAEVESLRAEVTALRAKGAK